MKSGTAQSKSADFRLRVFRQRCGSLSEEAPEARSRFYVGLTVTLAWVRTEEEARWPKSCVWAVNEDRYHLGVCTLRAASKWQTGASPSSFSPLLSNSAWILISLHPSPSCLIFSPISQLNQPTNHHPGYSAIIDHSQLLLPLKMFCWSLENQHIPPPDRFLLLRNFNTQRWCIGRHIQLAPNDRQVTVAKYVIHMEISNKWITTSEIQSDYDSHVKFNWEVIVFYWLCWRQCDHYRWKSKKTQT